MNTKIIAAMAVFAMMFAGFGIVLATEANDADPEPMDLVITVNGTIDEDLADALGAMVEVKYATDILDDAEDYVTILNSDDYKAFMKTVANGGYRVGAQIVFGEADLADEDFVAFLDTFTEAQINKAGELVGGVYTQTIITIPDAFVGEEAAELAVVTIEDAEAAVEAAVALAVIATQAEDAEAAEVAIAEAVEAAVAEAVAELFTQADVDAAVTAALAAVGDYIYTQEDLDAAVAAAKTGLYTKEQLEAAIADAKAKVKESLKDYIYTQADVDKAKDKAVADYIEANPVVKDETFLYVAIVLAAALIGLAVAFVYFLILKPKMAKKNEVIQV